MYRASDQIPGNAAGPEMKIIKIDIERLFEFLAEKSSPVMEIELIKRFANEIPDSGGVDSIFIQHFSLYHALYSLKNEAGTKGYYLHLDPMRIRLLKIPENGFCRHYMPEEGIFCQTGTGENMYCQVHSGHYADLNCSPAYDPLFDFYSNPDNIGFGNSRLLHRLMNGVRVYAFRKGEIDRALAFFRIENPGKKTIRKRYHELVREFHPDRNKGSETMMKKVNDAYEILSEVYIV